MACVLPFKVFKGGRYDQHHHPVSSDSGGEHTTHSLNPEFDYSFAFTAGDFTQTIIAPRRLLTLAISASPSRPSQAGCGAVHFYRELKLCHDTDYRSIGACDRSTPPCGVHVHPQLQRAELNDEQRDSANHTDERRGRESLLGRMMTTPDFQTDNNCPAALAPGDTCIVSVAFTPIGAGSRAGVLMIDDPSGFQILQAVAMGGTGIGSPQVQLSVAQSTSNRKGSRLPLTYRHLQ